MRAGVAGFGEVPGGRVALAGGKRGQRSPLARQLDAQRPDEPIALGRDIEAEPLLLFQVHPPKLVPLRTAFVICDQASR